jgi:hypothetical protein
MISNGTTAQNRYGMIASSVPRRPATALDPSAAPCFRSFVGNKSPGAFFVPAPMGQHGDEITHT